MVDPNAHRESYTKQEEMNTFQLPDDGAYVVMNTNLRRMVVGAKRSKKVRVTAHILSCVELDSKDKEKAKTWAGKKFSFDLWWDMSKEFNARRLCHLADAHNGGSSEPFDENDDAALVAAITGVPYGIKVKVKKSTYNNKERRELEVVEVKDLKKEYLAKIRKDPDIKKLLLPPDERMLETKDYSAEDYGNNSGGGDDGGSSGGDDSSWADDPDLPF